ncbi:MAG: DUF2141 domain-containing protein [Caulobacter sp.]
MIRSTLIAAALLLSPLAVAHAQEAAPAPAHAEASAAVTFSFPDIKTHKGALHVALFDSAEGWTSNKSIRAVTVEASDADPKARFEGLPAGTYAARVFQDIDGDGKMNRNAFGIPSEPFGFSNGAVPIMGPPSFEAAAFKAQAGDNAQTLPLY